MFVFRKIWRALFSWNTRFEIRPFALSPTIMQIKEPFGLITKVLIRSFWKIMHISLRKLSWRTPALREKCPYSKFFWSLFFCMRTEYGEIRSVSPYSVRMPQNTDHRNSEYGYFSRSVDHVIFQTPVSSANSRFILRHFWTYRYRFENLPISSSSYENKKSKISH